MLQKSLTELAAEYTARAIAMRPWHWAKDPDDDLSNAASIGGLFHYWAAIRCEDFDPTLGDPRELFPDLAAASTDDVRAPGPASGLIRPVPSLGGSSAAKPIVHSRAAWDWAPTQAASGT
jgi:hypothetical protein